MASLTPRRLWAGRILCGLATLFLAVDAAGKLLRIDAVVAGTVELGYPERSVVPIGLLLAVGVLLFAVPRTSLLGAIYLTGYLGGAVATHVRVGSPLPSHVLFPVYVASLLWGGTRPAEPCAAVAAARGRRVEARPARSSSRMRAHFGREERVMDPRFIWYELATHAPDAAEAFYRAVVGWQTAPAGPPGMDYTVLLAGDRGMGGLTAIPPEAARAGARPAWLGYVGVPDTDGAAKRIAEAGGAIQRAPDDIPGVGRFAVVADPGGATFMLLTTLPRDDVPAPPEPGTPGLVGWHELASSAGQAASFRFYAEQFGWETLDRMDMGAMGTYRIFGADGVPMGGMMDKPEALPASAWTFYVNVDGIDAAVKRIEAHGGRVPLAPHEVPGGSWIVQAVDPQGAAFALVSPVR